MFLMKVLRLTFLRTTSRKYQELAEHSKLSVLAEEKERFYLSVEHIKQQDSFCVELRRGSSLTPMGML